LIALILSLCALTTVTSAQGNYKNPKVLPPHSNAYGMTYGEWSAAWWQWVYSIPAVRNPILDTNGANCAEGQVGKVWFLAGTSGGGPVTRTCDVPVGKAIFFPVVNVSFGSGIFDCAPTVPDVPCDVDILRAGSRLYLSNVTELDASIDGVPLRNLHEYRAESPVFIITLPEGNLPSTWGLGPVLAGRYSPTLSNGYWLMLTPMSRGEHSIHFKATAVVPSPWNFSFTTEVTYHLNVVN
jgi:hypothetical protein